MPLVSNTQAPKHAEVFASMCPAAGGPDDFAVRVFAYNLAHMKRFTLREEAIIWYYFYKFMGGTTEEAHKLLPKLLMPSTAMSGPGRLLDFLAGPVAASDFIRPGDMLHKQLVMTLYASKRKVSEAEVAEAEELLGLDADFGSVRRQAQAMSPMCSAAPAKKIRIFGP